MTNAPKKVILTALLILVSSCTKTVGGPVKFGGYVRDIATYTNVRDYKMVVESSDGLAEVEIDNETGKFEFSTPVGADYIVTVQKEGYRAFVSTNRREIQSSEANDINETRSLYNVPLIPDSIKAPALAGIVVDEASGTHITSGSFRVASTGMAAGFKDSLYDDGTAGTPNSGSRWWLPDAPIKAGLVEDGTFAVEENFLLPGFLYEVTVFGAAGYRDRITALSIGTTTASTVLKVAVELTRNKLFGTPNIIAQSHIGPDIILSTPTPVPLGADRKIVITFDRDIIMMRSPTLKKKGSEFLLSVVGTADDNKNGKITATTPAAELLSTEEFSKNVSVTASGNKVTITLAADSNLINGFIDVDDDLRYTLLPELLSGIHVRDASSEYDGWRTLTGSGFNGVHATVIIRGNYP